MEKTPVKTEAASQNIGTIGTVGTVRTIGTVGTVRKHVGRKQKHTKKQHLGAFGVAFRRHVDFIGCRGIAIGATSAEICGDLTREPCSSSLWMRTRSDNCDSQDLPMCLKYSK